MKGFLFDENLPFNIRFAPNLPLIHSRDLGMRLTDSEIWEHAKQHDLVIVSKDADFSNRIINLTPPPRIVHLRIGNLRRGEFHEFLASKWLQIESACAVNKLVNVYLDRIECVA